MRKIITLAVFTLSLSALSYTLNPNTFYSSKEELAPICGPCFSSFEGQAIQECRLAVWYSEYGEREGLHCGLFGCDLELRTLQWWYFEWEEVTQLCYY